MGDQIALVCSAQKGVSLKNATGKLNAKIIIQNNIYLLGDRLQKYGNLHIQTTHKRTALYHNKDHPRNIYPNYVQIGPRVSEIEF